MIAIAYPIGCRGCKQDARITNHRSILSPHRLAVERFAETQQNAFGAEHDFQFVVA